LDLQCFGFLHAGVLPGLVRSQELLREPFFLCLPEGHPRSIATRATLADFRDEPFVLFARAFSPTCHDHVVSICVESGFHPKIKHEVRHWLTVMTFVSIGMGISLVPSGLARTGLHGRRFVDIGDSPVKSVVRGAWLESDEDDAILSTWRSVVSRVWDNSGKAGL
jgi:DNA-binding transcriptional LysR family regulator